MITENIEDTRDGGSTLLYGHGHEKESSAREPSPDAGWDAIAAQAGKVDEEKLQDLKEDIDTILVFAGLFSSVLTTFLSASLQNLQVDNSALTVQLLREMALQAQGAAQPLVSIPHAFSPSASSISVNVLWFGSLIMTITTASIGFLVKPHIRKYLSGDSQLSEQSRIRIRHFRYTTFIKWRFFQLATILRPLLQLAQGLFFVGLCIYTMSVHESIGITSILLVAFWACLFITLVVPSHMPGLEGKWRSCTRSMKRVISFCTCSRSHRVDDDERGRPMYQSSSSPYSVSTVQKQRGHLTICRVPGIVHCLTPSAKAHLLRSLAQQPFSDDAYDVLGHRTAGRSSFLRSVATLLDDYTSGKLLKSADAGHLNIVRLCLWLLHILRQTAGSVSEVAGDWETLLISLSNALRANLECGVSADAREEEAPLATACLDILSSITTSEDVESNFPFVPAELVGILRNFLNLDVGAQHSGPVLSLRGISVPKHSSTPARTGHAATSSHNPLG
ncbi:hypothetical protein NM688_g1283 [Phlebia brevispora]|uniref:Uncharacterized protein n=1 Tax=Phlebia brevispora TaxID=194682 RepID=A0ACC1TC89_9APHY|nr:hypothetical protein NM688_g1283 [Phlebia brevispora]